MWIFWAITFLCCIVGGLQFAYGMATANGAPQQAAAGVMALCWAVIPYVATRCLEGEITAKWRRDVIKALQRDMHAPPAVAHLPVTSPATAARATATTSTTTTTRHNDEVGKCPKCGTRRLQSAPVCPKCGNRQPVEFS